MRLKERAIRYTMLIAGVCIMSLGIALSIKAGLGTTSISCIPYVLYLVFPILSVGEYTILFNLLLVFIQFALLKKLEIKLFAQMIVCILFGYVIDFILWILSFLNITSYFNQWLICLIGCFVLAFGILIEVKSDITMLPGDGVVYVLADVLNKEFGKIKPFFDSSLVIIGAILSLVFLGYLDGVREGTIAAAILVGLIMKFYEDKFGFVIDNFLDRL